MRLVAPLLLATALASPVVAATPTNLRVHVTDGKDGGNVDINVPLSLAQAALALAPTESFSGTTVQVGNKEMKVAELRNLWAELKKAGDNDLVNVKDGSDEVRISTKGGRVLLNVFEAGQQKVRMDIPHEVVDALFSGDGDQLNISAALAKLQDMNAGEIMRVDDGEDHVRISLE